MHIPHRNTSSKQTYHKTKSFAGLNGIGAYRLNMADEKHGGHENKHGDAIGDIPESNTIVSKSWVFTVNNYADQDVRELALLEESSDISRMVVGRETGDSGTDHWQGAVIFKTAKRLSGVKKLLSRAHWEKMRGNWDQNMEYCTKEQEVLIHIDHGGQGKRNDLAAVRASIDEGAPEAELWDLHFNQMVRYHKGIMRGAAQLRPISVVGNYDAREFIMKPIKWGKKKSLIIWGDSGTGKTEYALSNFDNPLFVTHIDHLLKFVPTKHDGIIFDDMSFTHFPRETQIHILDSEQPRQLHCRYNTADIPAYTRKIFTTNVHGGAIFDLADLAIIRRVKVFEVTEPLFEASDSETEVETMVEPWDSDME